MPHFYLDPKNIIKENFIITDDQAHYLLTVRRFTVGDKIMLFDGLGNSYKAKILDTSKGCIVGKFTSSSFELPKYIVNVWTAIPKGDRFEWLIEKCGELGIKVLHTFNSLRSLKMEISDGKLERFQKISMSASSQCGRNDIMEIIRPIDFIDACKQASQMKDFINVLPWEGEEKVLIKDIVREQNVNIFIGPEGGFENEEIDFAKSLGFQAVTLGKNILRVETAAITASVLVMSKLGE
jgi:16S rRNA (uracil1498-N3)-methyltransferase